MKPAITSLTVVVVHLALLAPGAHGQQVTAFGDQGQVVLTADSQAAFHLVSSNPPGPGDNQTATTIDLRPSLLYFVAPNIAVGGFLTFRSVDQPGLNTTELGLGPTFALNVPLGPRASFLPQLGLGYAHVSADVGAADASGYVVALGLGAPFLFHLVPHFFIGVGPSLGYTLVSKLEGQDTAKQTTFSLLAMIGGWL